MRFHIFRARVVGFAAAFAIFAGLALPAHAQCSINIFVQNDGNHLIWVRNEIVGQEGTGVKAEIGAWRPLKNGGWEPEGIPDRTGGPYFGVRKGQRMGDAFDANLACAAKRRYRVQYRCDSGPSKDSRFVVYYPSADGWTQETENNTVTISLGTKCN